MTLPPGPFVIRLSCIGLFSMGPKLDNFCIKKLLWVQTPSLLTQFWLRFWLRYGFKNVRIVIEMTLKLLFVAAKSQKLPRRWELCPQVPFVTSLSCIGLFSTGPKLDKFCSKKFSLGASPFPLSKILVVLLVPFTVADRFLKQLYRPQKNELINTARLIRFFFQI